jgi:hypothetical protein
MTTTKDALSTRKLLYAAVGRKDAVHIATYVGHKRHASAGLDTPLWKSPTTASTHTAASLLVRLTAKDARHRDLQVILMTPTAYELPWRAMFQTVQHLAVRRGKEPLEDRWIVTLQSFLQHVSRDYGGRQKKNRSSLGEEIPTDVGDTPRTWLERIVPAILAAFEQTGADGDDTAHHGLALLPIITTILSMAQSSHDGQDWYKALLGKHVLAVTTANLGSQPKLTAWLHLVERQAYSLEQPDWIVLLQRLQETISAPYSEDTMAHSRGMELLQCLLRFYGVACRRESPLPPCMRTDPVWHSLILKLYQSACGTRHHDDVNSRLTASCLLVDGDVLTQWCRWTLRATASYSSQILIPLAITLMIAAQDKNTESASLVDPRIVLWEELATLLFQEDCGWSKREGRLAAEDALELVSHTLGGVHYHGKGVYMQEGIPVTWLGRASTILQESILDGVDDNESRDKLLIDTALCVVGSFFPSVRGSDLLLFMILLVALYEHRPACRRHILMSLRKSFQHHQPDGPAQASCLVLRLIVSENSSDENIWKCFSPVLLWDMSSDVFEGLSIGLMQHSMAPNELMQLCETWVLRPRPSAYCQKKYAEGGLISSYTRGIHLLTILCSSREADSRQKALDLLCSLIDGSANRLPSFAREGLSCALLDLLEKERFNSYALAAVFQSSTKGLFRTYTRFSSQWVDPATRRFSPRQFKDLTLAVKLVSRVLSKAKTYSDSALLVESMWPHENLLDGLFHALLEWQGLDDDTAETCELDAGNNDVHIAAAITCLSSVFGEVALDSSPILDVYRTPSFASLGLCEASTEVEETGMGKHLEYFPAPVQTRKSLEGALMMELRHVIADLALDERIYADKSTSAYKAYVLVIAALVKETEEGDGQHQGEEVRVASLLKLLDPSLLPVVFRDFLGRGFSVEQVDAVLALVLYLCRRLESMTGDQDFNSSDRPVFQDILVLYELFCGEDKIRDLLVYLECCGLNGDEGRPRKLCVLDLAGRPELETSVRSMRVEVLQTLQHFLETTASSVPWGVAYRANQADVRALFRALGRDLKMGLHGMSGGIDTDLCVAFLNCAESALWLFTTDMADSEDHDPAQLLELCDEALRSFDGIADCITIDNSKIVEAVLSLITNALPAIAMSASKHCLHRGSPVSWMILERLQTIRQSLFGHCLRHHHKRLLPQGELRTSSNTAPESDADASEPGTPSKSVSPKNDTRASSTVAIGALPFLTKLQTLVDSDRTWEWVFGSILQSYRDVLYDSYIETQEQLLFCKCEESRRGYITARGRDVDGILRNVQSIFDQGKPTSADKSSSFPAITLPSSVKSYLCDFLEQFSGWILGGLSALNESLQTDKTEFDSLGFMEALVGLGTWLGHDSDLFQCIRHWYVWEEKVASRAKSKQSVMVSETSFVREISSLLEQVDEVVQQLEVLNRILVEIPESFIFTSRLTAVGEVQAWMKGLFGPSYDLRSMVKAGLEKLRRVKSAPVATADPRVPLKRTKKRKNVSEVVTARNRNQLVGDWLEKDRDTDERMDVDAFADLEDFLVED